MKENMAIWHYVLIGLLVVSTAAGSLQARMAAEERSALIALYKSTNGDSWINNSGWKDGPLDTDGFAEPGTEEKWFGLIVLDDRVYEIHLANNNLSGIIPADVQQLKFLRILDVSRNPSLTKISRGLGNIPGLFSMDVSRCGLTHLPEDMGLRGHFKFLSLLKANGNRLKTLTDNIYYLYLAEGSDFGYNQLCNHNNHTYKWLNTVDPDWEETQTVPPLDLKAEANSTTSIKVVINPIKYTADPGCYPVFYRTDKGTLKEIGETVDKKAAVFNIDGLEPGTAYHVAIRTKTPAHPLNPNELISDMSRESSTWTHINPEGVFKLIVESSPQSAEISIKTNENTFNSTSKLTPFLNHYKENIEVTLTAPPIYKGKEFSKWVIDGIDPKSSRVITIKMCRDFNVEAFY